MKALTLGDFLRRIAIDYVRHGWFRYAVREIPQHKDLSVVDQKMHDTYQVTRCRTTRMRRRRLGCASVQYLRFERSFILLATVGKHEAFARIESRDIREAPLHFKGYSIGIARGTVLVEVERCVWCTIEQRVQAIALGSKAHLESAITSLPFYKFPGVMRQRRELVRALNLKRKQAGLTTLELSKVAPPLEPLRVIDRVSTGNRPCPNPS